MLRKRLLGSLGLEAEFGGIQEKKGSPKQEARGYPKTDLALFASQSCLEIDQP